MNFTTNDSTTTHDDSERAVRLFFYVFGGSIASVNAITIGLMSYYKQFHQNYSVLLLSLCVSDALSGLSIALQRLLFSRGCSEKSFFFYFFISCFSFVSQWHTVSLSLDRFVAVRYALSYHTLMTRTKVVLLLSSSWFIGCLEALCIALVMGCISESNRTYDILIIYVINLILVLVINAVLYSYLWRVARKQRRQIQAQLHQLQQQQHKRS